MAKKIDIQIVPLSQLEPDKNQPRKMFDADKMNTLTKSIERLGIKRPITVEKTKTGKYLIIDGERRYRAAKELGLLEVPVSIEESQTEVERLIEQFHLQEQQLSWTAMEKAIAILGLSKSLNVPVKDLAELLQLPQRQVLEYQAFAELAARKAFERSELPLKYAGSLHNLTKFIEEKFIDNELEFSRADKADFQKAIIHRVKSGEITNVAEFSKIRDIASKDINLIREFIDTNKTLNKLFEESDAKVAYHARNFVSMLRGIHSHYKNGMALGMIKLLKHDSNAMYQLKSMKKLIDNTLKQLD